MLHILNVGFLVFHATWVLFVCLGWVWKRTRPWHLAAVALTALSWFGLGIWYGWGYCLCTDWHWQIRERLGYVYDHSYTHLLIFEITRIDLSPVLADAITGAVFVVVTLLSLWLNASDFLKRHNMRT